MTINEIETYLSIKNIQLDSDIGKEIENLRLEAIENQNELRANDFWCLRQIYKIQNGFVSAVKALKEKRYEDAWNTFDSTDIALGSLGENFDIAQENDMYHLVFIGRMIKEYQKLFPYHLFFSRESIIKAEECSICGQPISLRKPCGNKVGKLYMGELCLRKITDIEFKAVSIVTDPFDKYTFVKLEGQEYNYGMLEELMSEINNPYEDFYVETIKVLQPEYKNVERNDLCPCGSGKKYKKCHLGTESELMDHHIIHMDKSLSREKKFAGIYSTWK